MKEPVYKHIARLLDAFQRCKKTNNPHAVQHKETILKLVNEKLPSGSGFDNGTKFDFERSIPNKLVFYTAFHHMNELGMYDGWTEYTLFVTPSLAFDIDLRIVGRNKNEIKDYIGDTFYEALRFETDPYATGIHT